jgi:hypothetical protein
MASDRRKAGIPVPAASRSTHLLAAALMWSLVGLGLLIAGILWILRSGSPWAPPMIVLAGLLGWFKARFVLSRTAERTVRRIEERGDGRCLGGFLSWKSWLLVAGMMLLGRFLRHSSLPLLWRGLIYAAIGAALFLASRRIWAHRKDRGAPLPTLPPRDI